MDVQIVEIPTHYVLFTELAEGTITAGQEGFIGLAAQ